MIRVQGSVVAVNSPVAEDIDIVEADMPEASGMLAGCHQDNTVVVVDTACRAAAMRTLVPLGLVVVGTCDGSLYIKIETPYVNRAESYGISLHACVIAS